MKFKNYLYLSVIVLLSSCSENSTDDLTNATLPETITYNGQIKAIIDSNCMSCHSDPPQNFAPMRLTTYNDVKNAILNRGLIDRISREQGANGMMPSGGTRLPQATINLLIEWQNQGLAE